MSAFNTSNPVIRWIEYRLPIFGYVNEHLGEYPTPKNLSYWWSLGSIAGLALILQIVTGIVLAMHYVPHGDLAFDSVEHIMRNVNYGWLMRYLHANGASLFSSRSTSTCFAGSITARTSIRANSCGGSASSFCSS